MVPSNANTNRGLFLSLLLERNLDLVELILEYSGVIDSARAPATLPESNRAYRIRPS